VSCNKEIDTKYIENFMHIVGGIKLQSQPNFLVLYLQCNEGASISYYEPYQIVLCKGGTIFKFLLLIQFTKTFMLSIQI